MLWQLVGDTLARAPDLIQTGVAASLGIMIIMAPLIVLLLVIVAFFKDVDLGPWFRITSKKRTNRRATDRRKK